MAEDRGQRPQKGEWNDGEFESFLDEIAPSLEQSVGRLGVAGHLGKRGMRDVLANLIVPWPDVADRIIEELR